MKRDLKGLEEGAAGFALDNMEESHPGEEVLQDWDTEGSGHLQDLEEEEVGRASHELEDLDPREVLRSVWAASNLETMAGCASHELEDLHPREVLRYV